VAKVGASYLVCGRDRVWQARIGSGRQGFTSIYQTSRLAPDKDLSSTSRITYWRTPASRTSLSPPVNPSRVHPPHAPTPYTVPIVVGLIHVPCAWTLIYSTARALPVVCVSQGMGMAPLLAARARPRGPFVVRACSRVLDEEQTSRLVGRSRHRVRPGRFIRSFRPVAQSLGLSRSITPRTVGPIKKTRIVETHKRSSLAVHHILQQRSPAQQPLLRPRLLRPLVPLLRRILLPGRIHVARGALGPSARHLRKGQHVHLIRAGRQRQYPPLSLHQVDELGEKRGGVECLARAEDHEL
jgi:hypothetical protein